MFIPNLKQSSGWLQKVDYCDDLEATEEAFTETDLPPVEELAYFICLCFVTFAEATDRGATQLIIMTAMGMDS